MNGHFWRKHLFGSYRGRVSRGFGTKFHDESIRFDIKILTEKYVQCPEYGKEIEDNKVGNSMDLTWHTNKGSFGLELELEEFALHKKLEEGKTIIMNCRLIPLIESFMTTESDYDFLGVGCCVDPVDGINWHGAAHCLEFRNGKLTTVRIKQKAGPTPYFTGCPPNLITYHLEVTNIVKCQTE